ncbi:MAG: hypothetical protein DRI81_13985, partial [Chloroflexi bacterium]
AQNPYGVLHFTRNSEGGVLGFSKKLFLSSAQNPYGVLHFTRNSEGGVLGFSKELFLSSNTLDIFALRCYDISNIQ